jgi:hypothetical protein
LLHGFDLAVSYQFVDFRMPEISGLSPELANGRDAIIVVVVMVEHLLALSFPSFAAGCGVDAEGHWARFAAAYKAIFVRHWPARSRLFRV